MPPATPLSGPVLVARRGSLLLALPAEAVGKVDTVSCSPPPPWSPAWVAGLAIQADDVQALVDALPAGSVPAPCEMRLVVLATGTPAWGLVIDAVEGMATAIAAPEPLPRLTLPSAWAHGGRLGDGRAVVLIAPRQLAAHFAGELAVAP